jgi:serine/threonine protein phosphatase 1
MELNIVSDIAGNYKTLLALVAKMPKCDVLAVGDLIDRGPRSKQVIEWFMAGNGKSLKGNHEHLMLNECRQGLAYEPGMWLVNGGRQTMNSYGAHIGSDNKIYDIPLYVLKWVESLPLYFELHDLFVSHSFVYPDHTLEDSLDIETRWNQDYNIIWSREYPKHTNKYQIAGHNSQWGLRRFSDAQGEFALGIDTSREKVLTGIHWPSRVIYQQPYID